MAHNFEALVTAQTSEPCWPVTFEGNIVGVTMIVTNQPDMISCWL